MISPAALSVPSTFLGLIVFVRGYCSSPSFWTVVELMKIPSAPELINACSSVSFPFTRNVIGIRIVFPLGFPTIIFETFSVWGGECAVSLPLSENPSLRYQLD